MFKSSNGESGSTVDTGVAVGTAVPEGDAVGAGETEAFGISVGAIVGIYVETAVGTVTGASVAP